MIIKTSITVCGLPILIEMPGSISSGNANLDMEWIKDAESMLDKILEAGMHRLGSVGASTLDTPKHSN